MSQRARLVAAWLVVLFVATLMTLESWLPGSLFLPLTPDDFVEWQAGRAPEDLERHPHPNWCMSDVLHLLVPGLATTRAALARGELPGWDPSQALGVPHLDQVHYGVFYPPAWIPLVGGLRGLATLAWLHLLLAAGGMLMYLRAIGRTHSAALAGAFAFALSGWMTARLHNFPAVGAAVWAPWLLWGLERGAAGAPWGWAVGALSLALSLLAGFPQVTLLLVGLALLLEGTRLFSSLRKGRAALLPFALSLAALTGGVLLAAPQLVPTLDYLDSESARGAQTVESVVAERLEPPMLAQLVAPDYYANAGLPGFHPLALRDLSQAKVAAAVNRAEVGMGIGVLGLVLALATMVFGRTWRTRVYTFVVLGVFTLLLWPEALAVATSLLPPLRLGNPKRLLLLSTFALGVLAAGGVDLVRRQRLGVVVLSWALSLLLSAAAIVLLLGIPSTAEPEDTDGWATQLGATVGIPMESVYAFLPRENFERAGSDARRSCILALAVGMAATLAFRPRAVPNERVWGTRIERVPGLLGGVIAIELALSAFPLLRAAPREAVTTAAGDIGRLRVPRLASAARGAGAESPVPPRLVRVGNDPSWLRPNFPGLFGLHDVQAYAPMLPARVVELLAAIAPGSVLSSSILGGFPDPARLALPAVDLLGVNVVLTDRADVLVPGLVEIERVGAVRVLRNDEALPRVFVVHQVEVNTYPQRRLSRLAAPDFDPWQRVLLEEPLPPPAGRWSTLYDPLADGPYQPPADAPAPQMRRQAEVLRYAPGRLAIAVGAGPPGVLVLSETWHHAWRATVAGRSIAPRLANHALLGVPLDGEEALEVVLEFAPTTRLRGLLLAGVGALLLLVGLGLGWVRSGRRLVLPKGRLLDPPDSEARARERDRAMAFYSMRAGRAGAERDDDV